MRALLLSLSLLAFLWPQLLSAQHRSDFAHASQIQIETSQRGASTEPVVGRLVLGAVAGGLAGAVAGGLATAGVRAILPCDEQDGCINRVGEWAVGGAFLGSSAVIPLGVHRANRRLGRVGPGLAVSAGIGLAGLGSYLAIRHYATDAWGQDRYNADLLTAVTATVTPIAQIAASIALERRTAR